MTGSSDPIPARAINGNHLNGLTNGTVESHRWKKVSALKQGERESRLAAHQDWRLKQSAPTSVKDVSRLPISMLTDREREIVHLDATDLVLALGASRYTAVEVTTAFCKVNDTLPYTAQYNNGIFR